MGINLDLNLEGMLALIGEFEKITVNLSEASWWSNYSQNLPKLRKLFVDHYLSRANEFPRYSYGDVSYSDNEHDPVKIALSNYFDNTITPSLFEIVLNAFRHGNGFIISALYPNKKNYSETEIQEVLDKLNLNTVDVDMYFGLFGIVVATLDRGDGFDVKQKFDLFNAYITAISEGRRYDGERWHHPNSFGTLIESIWKNPKRHLSYDFVGSTAPVGEEANFQKYGSTALLLHHFYGHETFLEEALRGRWRKRSLFSNETERSKSVKLQGKTYFVDSSLVSGGITMARFYAQYNDVDALAFLDQV